MGQNNPRTKQNRQENILISSQTSLQLLSVLLPQGTVSDWFLTKLPLKPGENPDCLPSGKSFQIFKLHLNSKRREKEREKKKYRSVLQNK